MKLNCGLLGFFLMLWLFAGLGFAQVRNQWLSFDEAKQDAKSLSKVFMVNNIHS